MFLPMKKAFYICLALLFLSACRGAESKGTTKTYELKLEGNTSAGYQWLYTAEPEGIVKELKSEFKYPEDACCMGSNGNFVFSFEGLKEGEVTLSFECVRPWENKPPAFSAKVRLFVDKDLNISELEKTEPKW